MTRFSIALLTLLLPAVLAAPSKRSPLVPCKRNATTGPYDLGNSTNGYGATGTGTGISLSTGVPVSILTSSLVDAAPTAASSPSPDPSNGPLDTGDDECPATTTVTSTNIVTETVSPTADAGPTQASDSLAAGFTVSSFSAGPYGNATGSSSQDIPGPTGTGGSVGTSSRHGKKHKHKSKTASSKSTATGTVEAPASATSSPASVSSDSATLSSGVAAPESSAVASAVPASSAAASPTLDPSAGPEQSSGSIAANSTSNVSPSDSASSTSAAGTEVYQDSTSTAASSTSPASSPTSASPTSATDGGEFYQVPSPTSASSSTEVSSFATSSSTPATSATSSSMSFSSTEGVTSSTPSAAALSSPTSSGVSATVAATPNGASSPGTGKRGLAYNAAALTQCFSQASQVSWAYNWASSTTGLSSAFQFVPMLWGLQSVHTSGWQAAATAAIATGATHLLSFNEPDLGSQSNLSPAQAVAGHKTHMQPFAGRAKISAPAVTNAGLKWLDQFLTACTDCTIDFVPVHWYDSATNIVYFKNYITDAIAAAKGRPIWLTEFGAAGTQAQQVAFLKEVMPWLDAQAKVERYAYFGVFDGKLVSGTEMSVLGQTFASFTT
ncbi:hypothetical protein MMC16_002506 [Acarospora aff. strigata]|nr:hypothetical protein [Acarospora aff. strigata]